MYSVIRNNNIIQQYHMFIDAWLFAYTDSVVYCRIIGPDGEWIVNPPKMN
jgi:hypothetical protein